MKWRIGSVPHLNARPLIYGIQQEVALCAPARLADELYRHGFDLGLAPVAEVLRHDQYDVINGIAVTSHGAVRSVFLLHRAPLDKISTVALDPASRSSSLLLRVLLEQRYGLKPEFVLRTRGDSPTDYEAALVFGDEAISYAAAHRQTGLDLGAAWTEWTGLPFVYAVWAVQRGIANGELSAMLHRAKTDGLTHLEEVIQNSPEGTPELRRDYLTKHIRYDLGDAEKAGLKRFQQCLCELKLAQPHELRFVD